MSSYVLLANLRACRCSNTAEVHLLSNEQLLTLANTNRELPDIVGEVSSVQSTITDGLRGPQRVMVTLRLEGDVNVCVSMFDDRAVTFQTKFDEHSSEPKVIFFTSINPKVVGGKIRVFT
ncbi:hypothetical protein DY000_02055585 [Brassica cretica]|uniref:Replication factor A C-terminal domain-containing protein n=1 Tax=Brassica cretica TaxID=69181 RepID=A0ABQ7AHS3_BRACR|nr:hypothetical protein DY000_02055585 [Brassica cretica]